jgi:DNA primase
MEGRADLMRVDVRLAVTDQPYRDLPWMIRCRQPGHRDSEYSMAVYRNHVCCYGCGFRIDRRMEALAYLLHLSVVGAIKRAAEFYEHEPPAKEEKRLRPLSPALAGVYQGLLWTGRRDRLSWLRQRGLSDEIIKAAQLGHDTTRFTIPVFDQIGRLVTIRFRRDDLYGVKWWDSRNHVLRKLPKYSGPARYNEVCLYPVLDPSHRHVFVTEGELDALRLIQEGYHAVTVTNGAGQMSRLFELLPSQIEMIYLVGDQDAVGRRATHELFIEAIKRGYRVAMANWDLAWGKDVTDLYLSGHSLEDVKWTVTGVARRNEGHPVTPEFRATA